MSPILPDGDLTHDIITEATREEHSDAEMFAILGMSRADVLTKLDKYHAQYSSHCDMYLSARLDESFKTLRSLDQKYDAIKHQQVTEQPPRAQQAHSVQQRSPAPTPQAHHHHRHGLRHPRMTGTPPSVVKVEPTLPHNAGSDGPDEALGNGQGHRREFAKQETAGSMRTEVVEELLALNLKQWGVLMTCLMDSKMRAG